MFTTNPETIQAGGLALRIISSGFIVSSISVTASGALEGLGKGVQSLLISLMRYVVIIMPAAFILSRYQGCSRSMSILDHRTYQRNSFCVDL